MASRVSPSARLASTTLTITRVPLIHGRPRQISGSIVTQSCHFMVSAPCLCSANAILAPISASNIPECYLNHVPNPRGGVRKSQTAPRRLFATVATRQLKRNGGRCDSPLKRFRRVVALGQLVEKGRFKVFQKPFGAAQSVQKLALRDEAAGFVKGLGAFAKRGRLISLAKFSKRASGATRYHLICTFGCMICKSLIRNSPE